MIRHTLTALCLAGPALAQTPDCVVAAIDMRQSTAAAFHAQITALVSDADPILAETARAAEDAQAAMRAVSRARVLHLIAQDPSVLTPDTTLSTLMNLQADTATLTGLRNTNADFETLEATREAAIARTQDNPDMEKIRALTRSDLAEPIRTASETLSAELARADTQLTNCLN
ncbi:MAG: hypothetical protein AAF813_03885 [Pseudomonadota bacterium]